MIQVACVHPALAGRDAAVAPAAGRALPALRRRTDWRPRRGVPLTRRKWQTKTTRRAEQMGRVRLAVRPSCTRCAQWLLRSPAHAHPLQGHVHAHTHTHMYTHSGAQDFSREANAGRSLWTCSNSSKSSDGIVNIMRNTFHTFAALVTVLASIKADHLWIPILDHMQLPHNSRCYFMLAVKHLTAGRVKHITQFCQRLNQP